MKKNDKSLCVQIARDTHQEFKMTSVRMGRTQKDVLVELIEQFIVKMKQAEEGKTLPAKPPAPLRTTTSRIKEGSSNGKQ